MAGRSTRWRTRPGGRVVRWRNKQVRHNCAKRRKGRPLIGYGNCYGYSRRPAAVARKWWRSWRGDPDDVRIFTGSFRSFRY